MKTIGSVKMGCLARLEDKQPPSSWSYREDSPEAKRICNGRLERITFITVRQGVVEFCRDGRTATVRPGSALLVSPGVGDLRFLPDANRPVAASVLEFGLESIIGLLKKRQLLEENALVVKDRETHASD